jgi:hypothetical protein
MPTSAMLTFIVVLTIAVPCVMALKRAGRRLSLAQWLLAALAVAAACLIDPLAGGQARVDGVLFGAGCLPVLQGNGF